MTRDSEQSICQARAAVMVYDDANKKWVPAGGSTGFSRVHIYHHTGNNAFRVVGRKIQDHQVVINCAIPKGLKYNQATQTFHQWRDTRQVYGLNFGSKEDANVFASAMLHALEVLTSQEPGPILCRQSPQGQNGPTQEETETQRRQIQELQRQKEMEREHQEQDFLEKRMLEQLELEGEPHRRELQAERHRLESWESDQQEVVEGEKGEREQPVWERGRCSSNAEPNAAAIKTPASAENMSLPIGLGLLESIESDTPTVTSPEPQPAQGDFCQPQPEDMGLPTQNSAPLQAYSEAATSVANTPNVSSPHPLPPPPPPPPLPRALTPGGMTLPIGPPPPPGAPPLPPAPPLPSGLFSPAEDRPFAGLAVALAGAKLRKVTRNEDAGAALAATMSGLAVAVATKADTRGNGLQPAGGGLMEEMSALLARRRRIAERGSTPEPEQKSDDGETSTAAKLSACSTPDMPRKPWERTNAMNGNMSPVIGRSKSIPTPSAFTGANGVPTESVDYEKLKQDILEEMRRELSKLKEELIDAIREELGKPRTE
ncbi:protein enabled homolog isoform X5 [Gouania willdenowi]|uniref:WH1 domain-containing protein n=1 Tax=Gouania willdenowi TaxID=441366 RepID=A0A8C5EMU3_GOUWI|nr:protein enabled homolog isoform X5 [Gouania willdenowi]